MNNRHCLIVFLLLQFVSVTGCSDKQESVNAGDSDSRQSEITSVSDEQKESAASFKRYEEEEGTVVYNVSGVENGTQILSWKEYGRIQSTRTQTTMTMMGVTRKTDTLHIMKGNWTYMIDYTTNSATKINSGMSNMREKYQGNAEQIGKEMMAAMGTEKTGTDTIAGRRCDIYLTKQFGSQSCIWQGIPLRNETGMGPMVILYLAKEVSDDPLSDEAFTLPENMTIQEISNPMLR